jgi:hypothetical protein
MLGASGKGRKELRAGEVREGSLEESGSWGSGELWEAGVGLEYMSKDQRASLGWSMSC